jgi:hypothetical protein
MVPEDGYYANLRPQAAQDFGYLFDVTPTSMYKIPSQRHQMRFLCIS